VSSVVVTIGVVYLALRGIALLLRGRCIGKRKYARPQSKLAGVNGLFGLRELHMPPSTLDELVLGTADAFECDRLTNGSHNIHACNDCPADSYPKRHAEEAPAAFSESGYDDHSMRAWKTRWL